MDPTLNSFLDKQNEDAMVLDSQSDVISVQPLGLPPHQKYMVKFTCAGLIRHADGRVQLANKFHVGIFFPDDYLRSVHPPDILTWLSPENAFHSNIKFPYVCIGDILPGTQFVEILHRLLSVISWNKFTVSESDALSKDACQWARNNSSRYPLPMPPLRRRRLKLDVRAEESGEEDSGENK